MPENEESPAVILGMGGIYAIVNGLGITDALAKFGESLESDTAVLLPYHFSISFFSRNNNTIYPWIHTYILKQMVFRRRTQEDPL